jgi:hypothetical protein
MGLSEINTMEKKIVKWAKNIPQRFKKKTTKQRFHRKT